MAAAAGAVTALILTQVLYGKADLTMVLNGALAGLVSITAEPLAPTLFGALWIGAIGGVIVVFTVPMLDKLKIDDVVGAIPVHLFAGIWGTLVVAWTNPEVSIVPQVTGVIAVGIFVSLASLVMWLLLAATIGLRPTQEQEFEGLDKAEIGLEAYPEFGTGSQRI
jgi:Amt family ammonium transporter